MLFKIRLVDHIVGLLQTLRTQASLNSIDLLYQTTTDSRSDSVWLFKGGIIVSSLNINENTLANLIAFCQSSSSSLSFEPLGRNDD